MEVLCFRQHIRIDRGEGPRFKTFLTHFRESFDFKGTGGQDPNTNTPWIRQCNSLIIEVFRIQETCQPTVKFIAIIVSILCIVMIYYTQQLYIPEPYMAFWNLTAVAVPAIQESIIIIVMESNNIHLGFLIKMIMLWLGPWHRCTLITYTLIPSRGSWPKPRQQWLLWFFTFLLPWWWFWCPLKRRTHKIYTSVTQSYISFVFIHTKYYM